MTRHLQNLKRALLTATIATVLLFVAPRLHAQDCDEALTEMEAALTEIEAAHQDVKGQRDDCFSEVRRTATERDECKGTAKELRRLNQALTVRVSDYDRVLADRDRLKERNWRFFAAGAITVPVLTGVAVLAYLAFRPKP